MALFDYDPHKSSASENPELELKLKEGDLLTVFGDMDINGYFEADLNGVRGLVPSLYVDEVEGENDSDRELEELLTRSHRDPVKETPSYKENELLVREVSWRSCLFARSLCLSSRSIRFGSLVPAVRFGYVTERN